MVFPLKKIDYDCFQIDNNINLVLRVEFNENMKGVLRDVTFIEDSLDFSGSPC